MWDKQFVYGREGTRYVSERAGLTYNHAQGSNFGDRCKNCYTEQRLDVFLEGVYTHIICTCDGIANIVRDLG